MFERDKIHQAYSARLSGLLEDSNYHRSTSISRLETFLSKYPNRPESAQIMIQLANFYYEVSKDEYIALNDAAEWMKTFLDLTTLILSVPLHCMSALSMIFQIQR